jgi:hypothetical protein
MMIPSLLAYATTHQQMGLAVPPDNTETLLDPPPSSARPRLRCCALRASLTARIKLAAPGVNGEPAYQDFSHDCR